MSETKRWRALIRQGRRAYQRQSFSDAEGHLRLALDIAEKFGDKDERLVESLFELVDFYQRSGDLSKADQCIKRAVSVGKKILNRRKLEILLKKAAEIARCTEVSSTKSAPRIESTN